MCFLHYDVHRHTHTHTYSHHFERIESEQWTSNGYTAKYTKTNQHKQTLTESAAIIVVSTTTTTTIRTSDSNRNSNTIEYITMTTTPTTTTTSYECQKCKQTNKQKQTHIFRSFVISWTHHEEYRVIFFGEWLCKSITNTYICMNFTT